MRATIRGLLVLLALAVSSSLGESVVAAEESPALPPIPEDPEGASAARALGEDDPSFGPEVEIERIEVVGNEWTGERLIRRALLFREGDRLRTGDPRFRRSRFRVLALGYFADVQLRLERGSARGLVLVYVEVVERSTFALDRIFLGTGEASDFWAGLDVHDANFLGSGLTVGAAFVWAKAANTPGAENQWGAQLRYGDPSVLGLPLGLAVELAYLDADEPYADQVGVTRLERYTRASARVGLGWDLTRQLRLTFGLRGERDVFPLGADGDREAVYNLGSVSFGLDRDTRADPVLTQGGQRLRASAELGVYDDGTSFLQLSAGAERWWPLASGRHVLSVHGFGSAMLGSALRFEYLHLSELDRLVPPRPLDLGVSTREPLLLFGGGPAPQFGQYGAVVELQYAYRLFRRSGRVYGGDLFVRGGLFGLADPRGIRTLPSAVIDITLDAGLRLDTEIGVFELSLANGLGRIPL